MSARTVNPAKGRLSSGFAPARKHPVTGKVQPHNGADIANASGTPVYAAHSGTVRTGYEPNGGGHWIILTSGNVETRYLHLSRRDVKPGQKVKAGQRIGLMGSTGNSTGSHLHFEVRVSGVPTDPVVWLAQRGVDFGGQFKPRWYRVDSATLNGRTGPGTGYPVKVKRERGFRIHAVATVNGWAVTRHGTFYSLDWLK